ncbi:MAG TPA: 6-bladed beta-propeller, partial [bacterium]|nr:6-bladed beta-propeller [bacterium]
QYFDGSGNYLGQWGNVNVFANPEGICVDSSGTTVYVVNSALGQITYFTNDGTYLGQWGSSGSGNGAMADPYGVSVDSSGTTVYVSDWGNRLIQYFTPTGGYLGQWSVPFFPYGIVATYAIAVTGSVDFIDVFYAAGSPGALFGGTGSSNTTYSQPYDLATDGSYLYIADSGNNRIMINAWGSYYVGQINGSSSGLMFNAPKGVAVDGNKNVYVADTGNNRIVKFGP